MSTCNTKSDISTNINNKAKRRIVSPVHPFGWDMKDRWRARWVSAATVLDRWASVSSYVGGTVARSRSKSTGSICSRVAHVCRRINPNCCWYMRFLKTFRECSILLPVFDEPVRNFEKIEKTCQTFWGCLGNDRFYRESAYRGKFYPNFVQILFDRCTTIKQIRVLVAFILQPEMKLPKIVPDPR